MLYFYAISNFTTCRSIPSLVYAGYIGRCISRRRKCTACKDLLIDRENIPSLGDVPEVKNLLLAMADLGGLFAPKQYCFAICALRVQIF